VAEQPIKVPNHCPVFFHWACPASSRLYYLIRRFSIHFSCPNFYELIPRKRKKKEKNSLWNITTLSERFFGVLIRAPHIL
jgi:hypothetical protein